MGPNRVPTLEGLGGTGPLERPVRHLLSHERRLIVSVLLDKVLGNNSRQLLIELFTVFLGER